MTAVPVTCFRLACDAGLPCCDSDFLNTDTEDVVLGESLETLRRWARTHGWVVYCGEDWCRPCTAELADRDHQYTARPDGDPFCAVCGEWPTDERHHPEIPGQLDLLSQA